MASELELLQNYIFLPLWPGLRLKRQEIDALLQDSNFPQLPLIKFLQICSARLAKLGITSRWKSGRGKGQAAP